MVFPSNVKELTYFREIRLGEVSHESIGERERGSADGPADARAGGRGHGQGRGVEVAVDGSGRDGRRERGRGVRAGLIPSGKVE